MHLVNRKWYRLYWAFSLFFTLSVIVSYILANKLPSLHEWVATLGLKPAVLILSIVGAIYCLGPYWIVIKRNQPLAVFGCTMVLTFVQLAGLILTDQLSGGWIYIAGWLINLFLSGMCGTLINLGALLIAGLFVMVDSELLLDAVSKQRWIFLLSSLGMTCVSYLFWHNRFDKSLNNQVTKLTGILRSKEELSAILIQSIADGVIVTSTDGKISLINRAAANMTGWTVEEAAGIDVQLVFKVAKESGEEISAEDYPFRAVLTHKAFINQVLQLTSRSGKKQVISIVISPVVTSTGEVFGAVAVMRDISEQRAAEAQRAEFISTASHEMRTPVAAIEGYLSLALNDKVSTIDSRARDYIEKAHTSTKHLGRLFQDLLTSAKAEDGRLASHPVVVEMGTFLEQLVEDLRFSAQKKGIGCEFTIGSTDAIDATKDTSGGKVVKPLYYVYVDPDRIREVISNIFDNAVKYTEQGKVSIGLTGNDEVVQMYIRDTGAGIPAEDVPHLFQKFYRVDNSATRTIGGTGLGLFIARKIVELYHGRIWLDSELGKGSTFFINLPRLSNQKAQQLTEAAGATAPAPIQAAPTTP